MAKKKKAPANPARGFATTSIVSKNKLQAAEESEASTDIDTVKVTATTKTKEQSVQKEQVSNEDNQETHQFTPEELEEQLERDDLQLLVEKYGAKVRRESSRQISKCETDLRLLRTQAQQLPTELLSEELISQIIEESRNQNIQGVVSNDGLQSQSAPEEIMVSRLWTLRLTLSGMGIPPERVRDAIKTVITANSSVDNSGSAWGLNESLEYLAKELDEEELPTYDSRKGRLKTSQLNSAVDTPSSSKTPSPSRIPARLYDQSSQLQVNGQQPSALETSDEDVEVSDLDSDLEPDELVTAFVDTKSKLYRLRPDLVDGPNKESKKDARGHVLTAQPLSVGVQRLQAKLRRFGSDPLFDAKTAEQRWLLRRIGLLREAALERRRDQSSASSERSQVETSDSNVFSENLHGTTQETKLENGNMPGLFDSDEADDAVLGGMFEAVPDSTIAESGVISSVDTQVHLRNFGKVGGYHPRRILEDTCRARDAKVRLTYNIVSPTKYACRHSVKISWTIPQPKIEVGIPPSLEFNEEESSQKSHHISTMTWTMASVAAPDPEQSEAYVATAALFCVFGNSATEGKSHLKLASVWRELYQEFESHEKENVNAADRNTVKQLRRLVEEQRGRNENQDAIFSAVIGDRNNPQSPSKALRAGLEQPAIESTPERLMYLWRLKSSSNKFLEMLPYRLQLPIANFKDAALSAIDQRQVLILCGETGCGKSTQLPAYILEHELSQGRDCKIYCTEPRRISAITLAQRVGQELGEHKDDLGTSRSMVGYAIRLESKLAAHTRLVYATVGVVLRMLESSKDLADITHLIIDEVHERSIDTDFLLIILKTLMMRRPNLKVVLMSATGDTTRFSKYLNDAPIVNVPGRTFPVKRFFLEDAIELIHYSIGPGSNNRSLSEDDEDIEQKTKNMGKLEGYSVQTKNFLREYDEYQIDHELIIKLMEYLISNPTYSSFSKAILVFLPGIAEIRELHDMLVGHPSFDHTLVYPLHSSIASEEQQQAFVIPPPDVRKIVLATNIAETGITIPDITCVIDCGRHREMRFDERRQISRLVQSFISRANAKQRGGRAGRVQEGLCFHLFTKYRHDEIMAEQQTPEMLRLSLQELIMRVKICRLGDIEQTLAQALDPPAPKNIRRAIDALVEVGALTPGHDLTALGSQLAKLPLDAMQGKLCLLSAVFRCLDVGLTVAAILSSKSPFVTPFGSRQQADQARLSFAKGDSDLLTAYNAYTAWKRVSQSRDQSVYAFCRKYFLSPPNLSAIEDLKGQLLAAMTETGLVPPSALRRRQQHRGHSFVEVPAELNTNCENDIVTSSVIAWSFYPKLLVRNGKGWRNVSNSQTITLHPTSVNKTNSNTRYLSYYSIMQSASRNLNALSTSVVHELPLLLLAGDAEFKLHAGIVTIDGNRLRFSVGTWKTAVALKVLRERMEEAVEMKLAGSKKGESERLRKWMEVFEKLCCVDGGAKKGTGR